MMTMVLMIATMLIMIKVSTEHLKEIHSLLVVRSHHSLQGKASQLVIIPCKERHHILSCKDCHFLCNRRLHDLCPRRIVMHCQDLHSTYLPLSCKIIITYLSCGKARQITPDHDKNSNPHSCLDKSSINVFIRYYLEGILNL